MRPAPSSRFNEAKVGSIASKAAQLGARQPQFAQQPAQYRTLESQAAPIDIDQFLDDVQPEAAAGLLLVEADAAAQRFLCLCLREPRAVILDLDQEHGAGCPAFGEHRDADLAVRPLARIVEQIAGHLLEITL